MASVAATAAVPGAGDAAATEAVGSREVPFATLWRTTGEGSGKLPYTTGKDISAAAVVWSRLGQAELTGPTFLSNAHVAALRRFPWSKQFLLVASIVRSTTGYRITVKRIRYQHPSSDVEQFCVIAAVSKPRPGQAVEQRRTVSSQVVRISRSRFGVSFSAAAILRGADGKLLASTTTFQPVRPGLCRP